MSERNKSKMNNNSKTKRNMIQFIKFCLVGVSNTLIGYLVYLMTIFLLSKTEMAWDVYVGNTVSFIISVFWSFILNNRFVFTLNEGEKRNIWKSLLKTYISYAFSGLILTNVLSTVWINMIGIPKAIAPLFCLPISIPVNFLLNKKWAFKIKK